MSRRNSAIILCILLLVGLSVNPQATEVEGDTAFTEEISRNPGSDHVTHTIFDGSDPGDFTVLDGISSGDGITLSMERDNPEIMMELESNEAFNRNISGRRTIVEDNGKALVTFSTIDTANKTVSFKFILINSREGRIEDPVLIHRFHDSTGGYIDVDLRNGMIYFLMSNLTSNPSKSGLFAKVVPMDDWFNTPDYETDRLDTTGWVVSGIDVIATEDGAVAFWIMEEDQKVLRSVLSDSTWSSPSLLRNDVTRISSSNIIIEGQEMVMLVFGNWEERTLNSTMSADGGRVFGSNHEVGVSGTGISSISTASDGHRLHVLGLNAEGNDIYHYMTDDGLTWSSSGVIASFTDDHPALESADIAVYRDQVHIFFTRDRSLESISSHDRGENFNMGGSLILPDIWYPSLEINRGFMTYWNQQKGVVELLRFNLGATAQMTTRTISPMGIRSWEGIGMDISGVENSIVHFRIKDDSDTQIFPTDGWWEITEENRGNIAGFDMDHVYMFAEDWSLPDTEMRSLKFEIGVVRSAPEEPVIERILIDHTTRFPLIEDFSDELHMREVDNLTITGNGLELDGNRPKGTVLIGPVRKEDLWADVMTIDLDAFNDRINIRIALLDENMDGIPTFSLDDSDSYNRINGPGQFLWNGRHFGELSDGISSIYIFIEMSKQEPTANPRLGTISIEYSEIPGIESTIPPPEEVNRGGSIKFSIRTSDREDPSNQMVLEVQSRHSEDTGWTANDHIKGASWEDGVWNVTFSPPIDADTGTYHFRVRITDTTMNSTPFIKLPFTTEVKNVRPEPPLVFLSKDMIRTGDDVTVWIERNGTDLETRSGDLEYIFRTYMKGSEVTEGVIKTDDTVTIPGNLIEKDVEWEVRATTFDGIDESVPNTISFTAMNSPPVPGDVPERIVIEEDGTYITEVDPVEWFDDIDGDPIELEVMPSDGMSISFSDDLMVIEPEEDFFGSSILKLTASDGEEILEWDLPVEVAPVNDIPVIEVPENLTVSQGDLLEIPVFAADNSDGQPVEVVSDAETIIPGVRKGDNLFVHPNGSLLLRTDNGMVGTHLINFTVDDGNLTASSVARVTIINVNEAPSMPDINVDPERRTFVGGQEIGLTGASDDPDIIWGDSLEYRWTSSVQGDLGSGKNITVTLEEGVHDIELLVTDQGGLTNSTGIELTVLADPSMEDPVIPTTNLLLALVISGLVIGILIGLMILLLSRRRSDKGKANDSCTCPEEPDEKESEEGKESEAPKEGNSEKVKRPDPPKGPDEKVPGTGGV